MDFINEENIKAYGHLLVLGSFILGLLGYYGINFLWPAYKLGKALSKATQDVNKIKEAENQDIVANLDYLNNAMNTSTKLSDCWDEYKATLHSQTKPDEMGQEQVVCWRSTVPAEVFFNVETLIAVELKTEYFKHQPGILTGLGIIGTFFGLLKGLFTFSVSSDPEAVRVSLDKLIHGVVEAFTVSVIAISVAMITTFFEKIITTLRIKQVEELCKSIDKLFKGGVGEEYLERLVTSSETSATQTAQLKDSLVSDLKEMLAEMTRQQTEAIAASFSESSKAQIVTTEQSGDRIAQAISDSLSEPLQKIAAAVNTTTDTNGEVVTRALNEALITFSQQMKEMFGGQMGDINQLLTQTTTAMQSTVARFDQLANSLGDAGKNAADVMSERLSAALESMEARQLALNTTMTEFVSQLKDMVQSSHSETNHQLQETLSLLGEKVAAMTQKLQEQAQLAANNHQNQQDVLQKNASALAQELADQVQSNMSTMQQQLANMLDVMQEQSAQALLSSTEHQKNIVQQTQNTVDSLSGKIESSMAIIDKQATDTSSAVQNQLKVMVDALKENTDRTTNIQDAQQLRFIKHTESALTTVSENVENTVKSLNETVNNFVEIMTKQTQQSDLFHRNNQQQIVEQTNRLVEQLSQQIQSIVVQANNAVTSMQSAVTAMRDVTKDNTQRMESSAGTLSLAADNFASAGNSVNSVIQQTSTVSDKMATTSVALNTAANSVQSALTDYTKSGNVMTQMVEELKSIVEIAKSDVNVSQSLVNQIKQSADHLMQAQSSIDVIFKEVCDELANAHEEFANNVVKGLKSSNTAYQKELKDAVDYLKSAIEELGEVAEKIPTRR